MERDDDYAKSLVADIERAEREILETYHKALSGGPRAFGYRDLYLYGIARRALAQSTAFRSMIDAKNSLVAAAILRMQLDTVLRLYALFWVSDPEEFSKKVFYGTPVNKLKAEDGTPLTDQYLKKRLAPRNPWIEGVYKSASGFIHFSDRHIKAAVEIEDSETGAAKMIIGPSDVGKPLSYYCETLEAFRHVNMMIPVAAADQFSRIRP